MIVCYECHTARTETVLVAEDQQQLGLFAMQAGDVDKATEFYARAREILLADPTLACKRHIPPLNCAATNERGGWPDVKVWLQSVFGTYVMQCAICKQTRPCIDCNHRMPPNERDLRIGKP
jgi:hypothetical protein